MRPELRRLMTADLRGDVGPIGAFAAIFLVAVFTAGWTIAVVISIGSANYAFGLSESRPRVMLPLSRHELGRALWWKAIGYPGIVFTLACLLVMLADGLLQLSHAHASGNMILFFWAAFGLQAAAISWLGRAGSSLAVLAAVFLLLIQVRFWSGTQEEIFAFDLRVLVVAGFSAAIYLYFQPAPLLRIAGNRDRKTKLFAFLDRGAAARPGVVGWAGLSRRLALRLLPTVVAVAAASVFFLRGNREPHVIGSMLLSAETVLLMLASPTTFFAECALALPLFSGVRALRSLPLSVEALAARLIAVSLAPPSAILLTVFVCYRLLAVPQANLIGAAFAPALLLMASAQALWVPALAPRKPASLALLIPLAMLTLPMLLLYLATRPWAARLSASSALDALASPVAAVLALAVIVIAYRATCRALRERPGGQAYLRKAA